MENNNGGQKQSSVKTKPEFSKADYEKIIRELYARNQHLENTWMLSRANFLFKVLEMPQFSEEYKTKAKEELENFLFPLEETVKEVK